MQLDEIQRKFLNFSFELAFMKKQGEAFQEWFVEIARSFYNSKFEAVRPYGKQGDLKCDGYIPSTGVIFQCYAPYEMNDRKLKSKIAKDFSGAYKKWGRLLKKWIIVHNDKRGISATTTQYIQKLRDKFAPIEIEQWCDQELYDMVMALDIHKIEKIFGVLPSLETLSNVSFSDISLVIDAIQEQNPICSNDVKPPSAEKLEKNNLSSSVSELLKLGRRVEYVVEQLFERAPQPDIGDRISNAFKRRYAELKQLDMEPDKIFEHLHDFAGFSGAPNRLIASLAVMSYFFERCDIFEDQD